MEPLARAEVRTPVVLIPGITGSKLRDRDTGTVRWGNTRSLFFPRDGKTGWQANGDTLGHPLVTGPKWEE